MLVRGHEHPPIKKALIDISDESYLITPLGKFTSYGVKKVNQILELKQTAEETFEFPYVELNKLKNKTALKLVSTCRKSNRILYKMSQYLQVALGTTCRPSHKNFVKASIGETQHLLFLYDELPDNREIEMELEIPHPILRKHLEIG